MVDLHGKHIKEALFFHTDRWHLCSSGVEEPFFWKVHVVFSPIFSALLICKPLRDFSCSLSVSSPGPCSWLILPFFLHFLPFVLLTACQVCETFFPFSPMAIRGEMCTADWQCYALSLKSPEICLCMCESVCVSLSVALCDRLNRSAGRGCSLNFRETSSWHLDNKMCTWRCRDEIS